ncbi:MAG: hypothetical protein DRG09_05040 [Epsilonproteobacteria bacterium]|nr:MAG: hypothetical protein DRG09_05040 [Campylobacterota bacterium]
MINPDTRSSDLKRNSWSMGSLCADRITFKEGDHTWTFLLVWNTTHPKGPFWYLPHDNEESAFDAAVYAVKHYGGGFLAVESNDKRHVFGKDPNRNFKKNSLYSKKICKIMNTYKPMHLPYLALHTNAEGHFKNGGSGTVSMTQYSKNIFAFPAGTIKSGQKKGLKDEDTLIYLAGKKVQKDKIKKFTAEGLNVKFEKVTKKSNDNSMSNCIVLHQDHENYINIETEHGDITTHKKMIDKVMKIIGQKSI